MSWEGSWNCTGQVDPWSLDKMVPASREEAAALLLLCDGGLLKFNLGLTSRSSFVLGAEQILLGPYSGVCQPCHKESLRISRQ